jgi:hypothetical protein
MPLRVSGEDMVNILDDDSLNSARPQSQVQLHPPNLNKFETNSNALNLVTDESDNKSPNIIKKIEFQDNSSFEDQQSLLVQQRQLSSNNMTASASNNKNCSFYLTPSSGA